ncbi:MAG: ATP synthase subunit I [Oscillospiraceae bacterium]|nr:ATP synthase subunit I [Oscillospiraceae bacterium]
MYKLSGTAKNMILVVCILVVVFIIASAIFYRSFAFLPFAVGAAMGGALNVLKIFLLNRAVERAASGDPTVTSSGFLGAYFLRFLLTAAVLFLAVIVPFISLWGAVAGVLTLPLSAYSMHFFPHQD